MIYIKDLSCINLTYSYWDLSKMLIYLIYLPPHARVTSVRTSDSQRSFMILKKLLWWSFHLSKNSSWLILIEFIVSEYLKMWFWTRKEHKLYFTWCFQVPLHLKCYLLKLEQIHLLEQFLVSTILPKVKMPILWPPPKLNSLF